MGRALIVALLFLGLTAAPARQRVNPTVFNSDQTISAYNMGDEVEFIIEPNARASLYRLQVAKTRRGRWTTIEAFRREERDEGSRLIHTSDHLQCAPGRFEPDFTSEAVYYRVLLEDDRKRLMRVYPPVRVPPWIDEHPEAASSAIDPNTPVTEMNAVDPANAVKNGC